MIFAIGIATLVFTLLGGVFALHFKDRFHLILGFSAGAVVGVAFFDLLPESIALGSSKFTPSVMTSIVALGFVIYLLLDRLLVHHCHEGSHCENRSHGGLLGAGSLAIHSFLDGVAIGLGFQASEAVGIIVTVAVLVHDFSDGINTVNIILKNNGTRQAAMRWLALDACAPILGLIATRFFSLSAPTLGVVLAIFGGFFFYIGGSDLLPESHHGHTTRWTTLMTILGMAVLYFAVQLAH